MTIYDPELAEIINSHQAVEIKGKQYYVNSGAGGSCDGCAFISNRSCPSQATKICTSNGGNILVRANIKK